MAVAPTIKRQPAIVSIVDKKVVIESTIISTSKPSVSWQKDNKDVQKINQHLTSTITEVSNIVFKTSFNYTI